MMKVMATLLMTVGWEVELKHRLGLEAVCTGVRKEAKRRARMKTEEVQNERRREKRQERRRRSWMKNR